MQRGQNEMSGKGGAYRYLGCFSVSYLTHHDYVRIEPEYTPQTCRKGQSHLCIHMDL